MCWIPFCSGCLAWQHSASGALAGLAMKESPFQNCGVFAAAAAAAEVTACRPLRVYEKERQSGSHTSKKLLKRCSRCSTRRCRRMPHDYRNKQTQAIESTDRSLTR